MTLALRGEPDFSKSLRGGASDATLHNKPAARISSDSEESGFSIRGGEMPATVDLTVSGSFGAVGEGLFMTGSLQPESDGDFEAFTRLQGKGTQQGYNSDAPPQFDEKNNSHRSILLSDVPIIYGDGTGGTLEGVAYREFLFNLNEPGGNRSSRSISCKSGRKNPGT